MATKKNAAATIASLKDYDAKFAADPNSVAAPAAKPARKPRAAKAAPAATVLTDDQANALLDRAAEEVDLATIVKETKKRKPSVAERGEDNKVLRTGKNLSGNQPFKAKHYYYDLEAKAAPDYAKAFNAAPNQVRLIMAHMEAEGMTTPDDALRGGEICGSAINKGALASKIDPAALFAYYRRVMETLGLRLA